MNKRMILQTTYFFAILALLSDSRANTNQVNDNQKAITTQIELTPTLRYGSFSGLYSRGEWFHWIDSDHDCQNERTEVLITKSIEKAELTPNGCEVLKGAWIDPYSGVKFTDPTKLDIDHIVPLKWANGHGGSSWPTRRKQEFANDFANLAPVDSSLNRQKGNKGPDEWMPPLRSYRCMYLKDFMLIVRKYGLGLTTTEKREIVRLSLVCAN